MFRPSFTFNRVFGGISSRIIDALFDRVLGGSGTGNAGSPISAPHTFLRTLRPTLRHLLQTAVGLHLGQVRAGEWSHAAKSAYDGGVAVTVLKVLDHQLSDLGFEHLPPPAVGSFHAGIALQVLDGRVQMDLLLGLAPGGRGRHPTKKFQGRGAGNGVGICCTTPTTTTSP